MWPQKNPTFWGLLNRLIFTENNFVYLIIHHFFGMTYSQKLFLHFANMKPWCSDDHYCTTSLNKAWNQVLRRFKPCSRRVGDSRWWGSLTVVPAGNKAKRLSSVNHTTKTIHHHHHSPSDPTNPYWLTVCYWHFSVLGMGDWWWRYSWLSVGLI